MAQHDQVIDNASGLAVRTDLNAAFAALFSSNSGTVEPTVKVAGQFWFDTTTAPGTIKIRNSTNTAWIVLGALSSVGMSTGLRASPDRWVVNDAADLTGNDLFWVLDTSGNVVMRERLSIIETDGSVRALFLVGMGADPGSLYSVVYNASGTEVNRWWMSSGGLFLSQGGLKFNPASGVLRAQITPDLVSAGGRLTLETLTNAAAVDGSAILTAAGLALNLAGDFYISRSGVQRGIFGWSAAAGAIVQSRDAAGVIDGELDIDANGADLLFGSHRIVQAGVVRGTIGAERSVAAGRIDLRSLTSAGVEDGYLTVSPNGGGLSYGDYFIWRGAVMRSNFGFDITYGTYLKHRDAAGAVQGQVDLAANGLGLRYGNYRWISPAALLRAHIGAERVAGPGSMNFETVTSGSVADGAMVLHAGGLALTLAGDFYVYRGGQPRANFGWDSTNGAYIRMRDAAGLLTTELGLGAAIATIRQTGTNFRYRVLDATSIERGSWGVDIANSAVYMDARDAAGAVVASLNVAAGLAGVVANGSRVRTDAAMDFVTGQTVVDFPVGSYVFYIVAGFGGTVRNATIPIRINPGGAGQYLKGNGTEMLSGTWRQRGENDANTIGLAQRMS